MSAFGRWMYSPWFWPPQDAKYDPIPNPYYDPACNLDDPATWQYQEDPFCEPPLIEALVPLAVFREPPLTEAAGALAVFWAPPLTEAVWLLATLAVPPLTAA